METYAAVRAHGLKSRLLTSRDYEALLREEKKISDFKDYSLILDSDTLETKLEKIYRVYISRIETVGKAGMGINDLAMALLDRLEVENIKMHLRYILGAQRPIIYYPYGRHIGPKKLSTLKTEGALWEELSKTPLQAPSSPEFSTALEAEREFLLDLLYYNFLVQVIKKLNLSRDAKIILENSIKEEFEKKTILWIRILNPSIVLNTAIKYHIPIRIPSIPEEWKNLKTTELMQQIQASLIQNLKDKIGIGHSIDAAYLYYFNQLALLEANNLEKILVGKEVRIPEEIIQRYITIIY